MVSYVKARALFARLHTLPVDQITFQVRSWADSFPTNFLLSQLSSKLEEKTASHLDNLDDISTDRDVVPRAKCPEHSQVLNMC